MLPSATQEMKGNRQMGSLDLWGAVAASFLLLQCIVLNLVWVALALGLWKGSEWVLRHAGIGLDKAHYWLQRGQGYVVQGERIVAAPLVRLRGRVSGIRTIWDRLTG